MNLQSALHEVKPFFSHAADSTNTDKVQGWPGSLL